MEDIASRLVYQENKREDTRKRKENRQGLLLDGKDGCLRPRRVDNTFEALKVRFGEPGKRGPVDRTESRTFQG